MTINLADAKLDAHWLLYGSPAAEMLKAQGYTEQSLRRKGPNLFVLLVKDWRNIEEL